MHVNKQGCLDILTLSEASDFGPKGLKVFRNGPWIRAVESSWPESRSESGRGTAGDAEESGEIFLSTSQGMQDTDASRWIVWLTKMESILMKPM